MKAMKKTITSVVSLRCKLIVAFRSSRKALAEKVKAGKLTNAMLNIAVRKLLYQVLKKTETDCSGISGLCAFCSHNIW